MKIKIDTQDTFFVYLNSEEEIEKMCQILDGNVDVREASESAGTVVRFLNEPTKDIFSFKNGVWAGYNLTYKKGNKYTLQEFIDKFEVKEKKAVKKNPLIIEAKNNVVLAEKELKEHIKLVEFLESELKELSKEVTEKTEE